MKERGNTSSTPEKAEEGRGSARLQPHCIGTRLPIQFSPPDQPRRCVRRQSQAARLTWWQRLGDQKIVNGKRQKSRVPDQSKFDPQQETFSLSPPQRDDTSAKLKSHNYQWSPAFPLLSDHIVIWPDWRITRNLECISTSLVHVVAAGDDQQPCTMLLLTDSLLYQMASVCGPSFQQSLSVFS